MSALLNPFIDISRSWRSSPVVKRRTGYPFLIATVVVSPVWGENGLLERQVLEAELRAENVKLATIERSNQRIRRQLTLLRHDPIAIERMVAEELGWTAEGATLYRFEDQR